MLASLPPPVPDDLDAPELPPLIVAGPMDVRSTSLAVLATLALIVFIRWAQEVFIPIALALLLSYALTPIVEWLKKHLKLPTAIGAAVTLILIVMAAGAGLGSLQPEALDILDIVPRAAQKFSATMRSNPSGSTGAVSKMQRAATEIERLANSAASPTGSAALPAAKSAPATSAFRLRDYLLTGTVGVAAGVGQLVIVVALVYFLLLAGDTFRRTLVRISGDTLSKKKITVQILDEIDSQIQRYLLVQLATSVLFGLFAWAVFAWVGLEHALTWACVGAVLHLIPYAGPTAFFALVALVGYVQFNTLEPVIALLGSLLVNVGVIALLIVPWLTQKVGSLNAVTVFVALLIWGWLWGVWGLLLGIPIVMAVKAVCERVDKLEPISAFLGHPPKKAASEAA